MSMTFLGTKIEVTDFEHAVLLAIHAHPGFDKIAQPLSLSTILEAMYWGPIPQKYIHKDELGKALLSLGAAGCVQLDTLQGTSGLSVLDLAPQEKNLWVRHVTEVGVNAMITHDPTKSEFCCGAYKLEGAYSVEEEINRLKGFRSRRIKKEANRFKPVLPSKVKSYNYIVRWDTSSEPFVKIGHSRDPCNRFRSFLTSAPFGLLVDAVWPSWWACNEKLLHQAFRPLHYTGEWFRYEGNLKSYVDGLGKNNEALKHVEKSNHPRIKTYQA